MEGVDFDCCFIIRSKGPRRELQHTRWELSGHGLHDNTASLGETARFGEDCDVKRFSPK